MNKVSLTAWILLLIAIGCTSTVAIKELPNPKTGKVEPATVKTNKILGIPCGTEVIHKETPKTGKELLSDSRESLMKWGTVTLFAGIVIAVCGIGVSIAFSTAHRLATAIIAVGAGLVFTGLLSIGLAVAMVIAIVLVVLTIVGAGLWLAKDFDIREVFKKWRSQD